MTFVLTFVRRLLLVVLPVLLALVAVPSLVRADGSTPQQVAKSAARIDSLIEQLGHEDYRARQRAQVELERLGLAAFDALWEALDHDNVEISLRASYLLKGMQIDWTREDDPAEVRSALRNYSKQKLEKRRSRMDRLFQLEDRRGTIALCRLARFDPSEVLSKRAALMVMRQDPPDKKEARERLAEQIRQTVGSSRRVASRWLGALSGWLVDSRATVDRWDELTRKEQEVYSQSPDRSSPEIIGELLLWQVDMLRDLGHGEQAMAVFRRCLDVLEDRQKEVIETLDWVIDRQAWPLIDEIQQRFSPWHDTNAEYLYRLAEARHKQGSTRQAGKLARQARKLEPDSMPGHMRIGSVLQSRGQLEWAEQEYRYVMQHSEAGTMVHVVVHSHLSEMLHDLERDLPAAEVLQQLVDISQKQPKVLKQIMRWRGSGSIQSRMHYFYARHYTRNGDHEKEVEHLEAAVKSDQGDADVLIAMYRLPNQDDAWRKKTIVLINRSADQFRESIRQHRLKQDRARTEGSRQGFIWKLAMLNNQFAWLIGNTEGDYVEALRCSHRSLELRPKTAGYLDTLGRCYYAKKDFANAVKYQSQAVRLDPYSGQIRRQLQLFQQALKKSRPEQQESGSGK